MKTRTKDWIGWTLFVIGCLCAAYSTFQLWLEYISYLYGALIGFLLINICFVFFCPKTTTMLRKRKIEIIISGLGASFALIVILNPYLGWWGWFVKVIGVE